MPDRRYIIGVFCIAFLITEGRLRGPSTFVGTNRFGRTRDEKVAGLLQRFPPPPPHPTLAAVGFAAAVIRVHSAPSAEPLTRRFQQGALDSFRAAAARDGVGARPSAWAPRPAVTWCLHPGAWPSCFGRLRRAARQRTSLQRAPFSAPPGPPSARATLRRTWSLRSRPRPYERGHCGGPAENI